MPKLIPTPHEEVARRDTIGLRTILRYDPMAPRPATPVLVGRYVVARRPLDQSVHTLYMIMDGKNVVATLISHPSENDCATAIKRHRCAVSMAANKIKASAVPKKRKARALRTKEAA